MPAGNIPLWRDEARRARMIEAAGCSANWKTIAECGGVSYHALKIWRDQAQDPDCDPELVKFINALREARSSDAVKLLKKIGTAAEEPKGWGAAAWLLERVHGYGAPKQEVEHSGAVRTGNAAHDPRDVLREELDDLPPEVRKSLAGGD